MKFRDLMAEAKATYCGRCGTTHVPPSKGGTCPALSKEETQLQGETMSPMEQYLAAIEGNDDFRGGLTEKKLTPAEMKKREEVAQAIERENPDMPMDKKMAIATATAKKVAEESEDQVDEAMSHQAKTTMKHIKNPTPGEKQAAKDIKPGKSGYADRIAMLKSAQARGALKNEEVEIEEEQLDELDTSTLKSYAKKANKQLKTLNKVVNDNRGKLPNQVKKSIYRQQLKRDVGIDRANSKLSDRAFGITKEEVEQIDELSKSTLGSYADKAERSASKHFDKARDAWERGDKESDDKNFSKGSSRIANASKARMKMAKEEADMHYCAKHVYSERFGEGFVVEGSHAEPDENGLIEWYDVDFGGAVRRVMTEKVKVMHAEYHMNHKKKMKEEGDPTHPKTAKEKDLAKLAPPHDKITHADVMVGRGVKKEELSSKEKMKRGMYNEEEESLEEATPTGIKIYHKDAKTGKEHDTTVFSSQDAHRHEKTLGKAGHKVTGRSLMFGSKEGPRKSVSESVSIDEATPTKQQVKQAIGIARDKRYAGGNMTGATQAMDKINKGLAQHPAVAKELKKQNEETEDIKESTLSYSDFVNRITARRNDSTE